MNYGYVRCNSCRWQESLAENPVTPGELLARHAAEDCSELRGLMVPMWSVAWPWYHTPDEDKKWGLEMEWRPCGTHSVRYSQHQSGADAKQWWLMPIAREDPVLA